MSRTITTHAPEECGCQAISWYAVSDCGNFDDGDTDVAMCEWHAFKEDAFALHLEFGTELGFDEIYWMQRLESLRESDTWMHEYAWSQVRPAADYCPF